MSEDAKKSEIIRIPADAKKTLEGLAEKSGMGQGEIVGYLIDQCVKWGMIDPEVPDWVDKVREEVRAEIEAASGGDDKVRTSITIMEAKAMLDMKKKIFLQWLQDMPIETRRDFTERMLGTKSDAKNPGVWLAQLTEYQLFKVNGTRIFSKSDEGGLPEIKGVKPDQIVTCANGLHVVGAWCQCNLWRTCPLRVKEQGLRDSRTLEHMKG